MAAPTTTYRMWKRLASQPGGTRLFSAAAMVRVPYFASIGAECGPDGARVCGGRRAQMVLCSITTVPTSHRWIPKSMNVQYLAKATTSLRAHARLDPPEFTSITDGAEIVVPVGVVDKAGVEVVHADITCWVTPA